jgi:hypothetical protein
VCRSLALAVTNRHDRPIRSSVACHHDDVSLIRPLAGPGRLLPLSAFVPLDVAETLSPAHRADGLAAQLIDGLRRGDLRPGDRIEDVQGLAGRLLGRDRDSLKLSSAGAAIVRTVAERYSLLRYRRGPWIVASQQRECVWILSEAAPLLLTIVEQELKQRPGGAVDR